MLEFRPPRVVVVDDDRLMRELARDALGSRVRVECCESGAEAIEALRREPAELVISDLNMPGMDGLELLERVRRELPGTDFVLLTANASVESAVGALRMGASDYLTKPLRPEDLVRVVERTLATRHLLQENERLRDALRTLESCQTLVRCLDASEVYATALDLVLSSQRGRRGAAVFRRTSVPMSDGVAFRGFNEEQARRLREELVGDKPFDFDCLGEVRVVEESPMHDALRASGIACDRLLAIPVRGRETEAGLLGILEDGHPFAVEEIERATQIATHAKLAIGNAERYGQAKERAFVDDTTDVYNARYLLQAVEHEIQRAERYGRELSVLFLDLDRFKLVNDQYGHLVGSRVLRRLSEVLLTCIRQVDTLARYGGDEFTILLVDTGLDDALAVAERIRRAVAETLFEGGRDRPIRLTLSVGAATYPQHGRTREQLLDQADKAMYRAKSLGRNRLCSASQLTD